MQPYEFHKWLATGLIDDGVRRIVAPTDVAPKRTEAIEWIWGDAGFPDSTPTVESDVASPYPFTGVSQCDYLLTTMSGMAGATPIDVHVPAYHYRPTAPGTGLCLVVVHGHGHCTQGSGGLALLMQDALSAGHSVVGIHMPAHWDGCCGANEAGWGEAGSAPHDWLFANVAWSSADGSPERFFITGSIEVANLLQSEYDTFAIAGLSGGGQTAVWVAALDTRFLYWANVSGMQPLYMRAGPSDAENDWPRLYEMAGCLDLMIMASAGAGRRGEMIIGIGDPYVGPPAYSDTGRGPRIVGMTFDEAHISMCAEVSSVAGENRCTYWVDNTALMHGLYQAEADRILAALTQPGEPQ